MAVRRNVVVVFVDSSRLGILVGLPPRRRGPCVVVSGVDRTVVVVVVVASQCVGGQFATIFVLPQRFVSFVRDDPILVVPMVVPNSESSRRRRGWSPCCDAPRAVVANPVVPYIATTPWRNRPRIRIFPSPWDFPTSIRGSR